MANPKITLTVDQECMDILNKAVDALNRFCDSCAALQPIRAYHENAESEMKAIDLGAGTVTVAPAAETAAADVAVPVAPVIPDPAPFQFQMPAAAAPAVPQMPTMQFATPAAPAAPAMPTTTPTFTMEQLGRAGLELSQRGVNVAAIMASEFQVMSLNDLPKDRYAAFAARLRQLGANI